MTLPRRLGALGVACGLLAGCDPSPAPPAPPAASVAKPVASADPPTYAPVQTWPSEQVRPGVYPCADPTNICDHFRDIGCDLGRQSGCRDRMALLGEDVCLKLYEAKTPAGVRDLGVTCNP